MEKKLIMEVISGNISLCKWVS